MFYAERLVDVVVRRLAAFLVVPDRDLERVLPVDVCLREPDAGALSSSSPVTSFTRVNRSASGRSVARSFARRINPLV